MRNVGYSIIWIRIFVIYILHPPQPKGTGKQPSLSPSAGWHLIGCCYFGSSLMLANLSVFLSGVGPPATNIFLAAFSKAIERPDPTRPCLATQCTTFPLQDIDKSNFPPLNPQQQQVWYLGSQRLIILRSRPYFSANQF